MNKLLIVLLAVCLFSVVSAHTFVKREAPTADEVKAQVNAFQNKVTELAKQLSDAVVNSDIVKKVAESVKPEEIKKNVNDVIDIAAKELEKFKPVAPAAGDAKPAA